MMKSVLITGASRGIGAATARLFSEKGWRVIINYNRSETEALSLAAELGAEAIHADISKSDEVNAMAAAAGSVDVLVNNAGICGFHMLDAMSDEDWDRIMSINLTGVFYH